MKRILVPCDFSDPAVQAFKLAAEIARENHEEVLLLNVVELPVLHDSVMMPTLSFEEAFLKEVRERAMEHFKTMKEKWGKDVKLDYRVEYGATAPTIRQFIDDEKIDLVIMGTHGASGMKELFLGSNAEKIVRSSPVPVLTIKKQTPLTSIKNIVFPTLPTTDNDDLLNHVKDLQNFFKAKLHVLYVNTPALFTRDTITHRQMKEFAQRYMLKDYTLNVYNDLSEEEGVRNFTTEIKGDLIAMTTHGRKGLAHVLSGSIAEDVVNHVECPIWTYKLKGK